MATRKARKAKKLPPLPDGISLGDTVSVYFNGWRTGKVEKVEGALVGIQLTGTYLHEGKTRLKWVGMEDIRKVDG